MPVPLSLTDYDDVVPWASFPDFVRANSASMTDAACLDDQPPAVGHGIARVEDEIEPCCLELLAIGENPPASGDSPVFQMPMLACTVRAEQAAHSMTTSLTSISHIRVWRRPKARAVDQGAGPGPRAPPCEMGLGFGREHRSRR